MVKLDKKGLAWGVLLAVVVNGLYETIKSLLEGNYKDETIAFASTCIVALVVMLAFWKLLFRDKE